jgi:GAF domain-containing protein
MAGDKAPSELALQLRKLVAAVEASGHSLLPASDLQLLQTVVEAAAQIFGAAASSICLVDESGQMLEFKVAIGKGSQEVLGMRIPVDHGIAGYVAQTGQPIAISNVRQDPRFNQEFAESTGYVPQSILATPLLIGDRVIGVMEVLDKISAPSFGIKDMELLGVFARQAAIAIEQAQQMEDLSQALVKGLDVLAAESADVGAASFREVLTQPGEGDAARRRDLADLAGLLFEISQAGEDERQVALKILSAFRDYLAARPGGW